MVTLAHALTPQVLGMPEIEPSINSVDVFDITDETIISYDSVGNVLSKYGDDTWKFETSKVSLLLNFNVDFMGIDEYTKQQIKMDLKSIQFTVMHTPSKHRSKVIVGFSRQKRVNTALRSIVEIALEHGFDFKLIFTGKYNHYLDDIMSPIIFEGLSYLLSAQAYLRSINIDFLEGKIPLISSFEKYVAAKNKELNSSGKQQTLPIPERIYLLALEKIEHDLNVIDESLLDKLFLELAKNTNNPLYGLKKGDQICKFRRKYADEYRAVLEKNNWSTLPPNYDFGVSDLDNAEALQNIYMQLDKGLSDQSVSGLRAYLTDVQKKCFRALIAYTGGRLSDISFLNSNALVIHKVAEKSFPLLYGEVQKGTIIDDDVEFWVTNEVGQKAFNIAKKISDFIYETALNKNFQNVPEEERLLFVSQAHSRTSNRKHNTVKMTLAFYEMRVHSAVIDGDDRIELMRLDPSLELERDSLAEGYKWEFKAHQFRRSLSLYAMASGAVSLPSLRRQLRHLGEAMTLYYSGGSCAASNILYKNNSFAKECASSKSASTAIALHKFVVSDERIYGGMGRHLEKNPQLKNIILDQDISETKKMVERGELSFSETALGGCGETGNCDFRPFSLMDSSHCIDCNKSYHKLSVINKTILIFEVSLDDIPLNTRQRKWRELQIKELKDLRDSHVAQQE